MKKKDSNEKNRNQTNIIEKKERMFYAEEKLFEWETDRILPLDNIASEDTQTTLLQLDIALKKSLLVRSHFTIKI